MLEDLEFLAGVRDSLSGQAIIFTTNLAGSDNPFNPRHPAMAVATDPSELADILASIIPFPEEMRDMLHKQLKQSADMWTRTMFGQKMYQAVQELMSHGLANLDLPEEITEQIQAEMKSIPDEKTETPHHGFFVPLVGFDPDVIEPYKSIVDLARAPDVPNISFAGLVLSGHAQHYLASYLFQREHAVEGAPPRGESDAPHFSDLSRDDFLVLLKKKVSEIMYAQETEANGAQLLRDLVKMTSGTLFVRDVLNLSRVAQSSDHPARIVVIELYLERIRLLALERYEESPTLDAKLAELDPDKPAQ